MVFLSLPKFGLKKTIWEFNRDKLNKKKTGTSKQDKNPDFGVIFLHVQSKKYVTLKYRSKKYVIIYMIKVQKISLNFS